MNADLYTELFGQSSDKETNKNSNNNSSDSNNNDMHNLHRQNQHCNQQDGKKPSIKTEKTIEKTMETTTNDIVDSCTNITSTDQRASNCYTNMSLTDRHYDGAYWEKRRRNNESAKRSRDSRRLKEEQIALRVVYLEQENLQLHTEVSILKNEIERMRCMLYEPLKY